ncbi:hypothetical protein IFU30_02845 [Plantibacter sp. CFBP 8798]|uniref:hypothetical protein n=1 Tax=Plantibacter sp. CFBP 8798 TaxID=2775268 RepID=UPI00177C5AE6|nr:hypothetical protein [Plantibacter sp. CFBP 8798]MBD8465196.1 hypothetical protein [Plantibacter sp. CFBP 8798]
MESLIQQRLAFERERTFGWVAVVLGTLLVAGSVWAAVNGMPIYWLGAVVWGVSTLLGVQRIRRSARTREAFERQHGKNAGVRT